MTAYKYNGKIYKTYNAYIHAKFNYSLVKFGLKDKHSETIYCLGNSIDELQQEFDLSKYRVQKLTYKEGEDGHELIESIEINNLTTNQN